VSAVLIQANAANQFCKIMFSRILSNTRPINVTPETENAIRDGRLHAENGQPLTQQVLEQHTLTYQHHYCQAYINATPLNPIRQQAKRVFFDLINQKQNEYGTSLTQQQIHNLTFNILKQQQYPLLVMNEMTKYSLILWRLMQVNSRA